MPKANDGIVVLQLSDSHLHATRDSRMRGVNTYDTLTRVLEHIERQSEWKPDLIVATGDLVQDESRAGYRLFRDLLEPFGTPVACIPGNHDDPLLMAEELGSAPFQFGGCMELDGWSVVMLNTHVAGDDAGRLGPSNLAALADTLDALDDKHALICMHHQPIDMGSAWLDGVGLKDAEAFVELIGQYSNVAAVVWGHVHQASDRLINGIRFLSAPSTCSQFLPHRDYFAVDDRPPGYRWLKLLPDGTLDTEVGWVD